MEKVNNCRKIIGLIKYFFCEVVFCVDVFGFMDDVLDILGFWKKKDWLICKCFLMIIVKK